MASNAREAPAASDSAHSAQRKPQRHKKVMAAAVTPTRVEARVVQLDEAGGTFTVEVRNPASGAPCAMVEFRVTTANWSKKFRAPVPDGHAAGELAVVEPARRIAQGYFYFGLESG